MSSEMLTVSSNFSISFFTQDWGNHPQPQEPAEKETKPLCPHQAVPDLLVADCGQLQADPALKGGQAWGLFQKEESKYKMGTTEQKGTVSPPALRPAPRETAGTMFHEKPGKTRSFVPCPAGLSPHQFCSLTSAVGKFIYSHVASCE